MVFATKNLFGYPRKTTKISGWTLIEEFIQQNNIFFNLVSRWLGLRLWQSLLHQKYRQSGERTTHDWVVYWCRYQPEERLTWWKDDFHQEPSYFPERTQRGSCPADVKVEIWRSIRRGGPVVERKGDLFERMRMSSAHSHWRAYVLRCFRPLPSHHHSMQFFLSRSY